MISMKSLLFRLVVPSLVLLAPVLSHADFNPAIVPADSQWLLHADLGVLRGTAIGQRLLEKLPEINLTEGNDPVRPNLRKIMETVGSATAFGTDLSGKPEALDGALVLQGTPELRKIVEGYIAQASLSEPASAVEIKDVGFEAYSISNEVFVGLPSEPIVLVSKSKSQLMKTLEVYRGKSPSLAMRKSVLSNLIPKEGKYFLMGASVVPSEQQIFDGNGPQARILQMAKSASVAIGEEGERATGRLQLVSSSPELATKLVKIVEGVTAMLSLAETDDQRLKEFADALSVQRSENQVTVGFSYPTARLFQMMDDMQRAKETHAHAPARSEEPPAVEGEVVMQWTARQQLGGDAPGKSNFAQQKIPAFALAPGATILLTGRREGGEHARWDYLELTPAGGGAPQRFEAEYMRLHDYEIETSSQASGGEVIKTNGEGAARFRFTGAAGNYTATVGYVDEDDGASPFVVSVIR
jgi:hypothetical protein